MLLTLIHNVTLLIALSLIWVPILKLREKHQNLYRLLSGILFGLSAIVAMVTPVVFEEGIIYDGRSIVIAISGLYGGGFASLIASLIAGSYRIFLGGPGVYAGVASVIVSALSGLVLRRMYKNYPIEIPFYVLIGFAVITHVLVLLCQLILLWPQGLNFISTIGIQYLIVLSFGLCTIALIFREMEIRTLSLQNLKAGADLLQDVLSVGPSVMFIMNPKTKGITWISPNVESILGYKPEEVLQLNFFENSIYKDDLNVYKKIINKLDSNNYISDELRIYNKFGTIKWININIRVIRNNTGEIAGLFGSITDITRQRIIVERLNESEERYRSIFKNSKAVMLIINPDDGTIVDANDAAVDFYGWSKDELLGMKIQEINKLTIEEIKTRMQEVQAEKRVYFEFKHRKKNGEVADVEVYSSAITIGDKQYLFSIIHDITEKKKTQEELIKSQDLFRLIFDNAPVGIYSMDKEGIITAVNDNFVKIIGSSRESLVGLDTKKLKDKKVVKAIKNCLNGKLGYYEGLYSSVTANKVSPVRVKFAPLIENNQVLGGIAIVEDITEEIQYKKKQENLEKQLRQSQKLEAVGRLVAGIAHDFNNILSIITGYIELIKFKITENQSIEEEIEEIKKAAQRSAEIVRQLLLFSGTQADNPTVLNVNKIINDIKFMLNAMVGEKIKIKFKLDKNLKDIYADKVTIVQILTNFVSNSVDAIKKYGNIVIETRNIDKDDEIIKKYSMIKPDNYVLIKYEDNGSGIKEEDLDKIFEPFFTTKEVGKGSGLGLSTVYGIVKKYNGYIQVESQVGKGTTFYVLFPQYNEDVSVYKIQDEINEKEELVTKGVLLVEDDVSIKSVISKMLKLLNQNVYEYDNPMKVIVDIDDLKDKIEIIITDVVMPEMNGVELVNELKEKINNLKVIYITGYSNEVLDNVKIDNKDVFYLQKPFSIDELQRILYKCCL